ncbi:MAG: hypothetical protein AABX34_02100 [Nanoarchaeota archaeon]
MATFEGGMKGEVIREIPMFSVKYRSVFSLRNLYIMMHELLLEERWLGFDNQEADLTAHSDVETLYSENVYQPAIHLGGKEMWIWWRLQKYHERPSAYFLNLLDIDWHVVRLKEEEVVHQGKKTRAQLAELEMFFRARIISDVGEKWEHSPVLKHLKHIYERRIMYAHIEKREKDLWREVYRIQSKVKAYLKLRTWMPTPELFHPALRGFEGEF